MGKKPGNTYIPGRLDNCAMVVLYISYDISAHVVKVCAIPAIAVVERDAATAVGKRFGFTFKCNLMVCLG